MEFDEKRFQIIDHPLVQHKLHILRDKNTSTKDFRELVTELAVFEGYEAMRDLPLETAVGSVAVVHLESGRLLPDGARKTDVSSSEYG